MTNKNTDSITDIENSKINKNNTKNNLQTIYLTETETECFCDFACLSYNDCCFDYKQYCQRNLNLLNIFKIFIYFCYFITFYFKIKFFY